MKIDGDSHRKVLVNYSFSSLDCARDTFTKMAEFWLISAPGDKTPQQTYLSLKARMTGLSPVFQLNLPELKVGII